MREDLKAYLPTTLKEVRLRGWEQLDVILFSGDAYVDHPSFGVAVIGRVLEAAGYKVGLVPQPDWRGDGRDFTKLGAPRLFFGVSSGCMDSMVNHYTANKRRRSDDAYSQDDKPNMRPDYCVQEYCMQLRKYFPSTPIVIGGIEASMRRFAHYDYWQDCLLPSILQWSGADLLVYGMGERSLVAIARYIESFGTVPRDVPQTAFLLEKEETLPSDHILLHSFEAEQHDKRKHAENFRTIEMQSNMSVGSVLVQATGNKNLVVLPPYGQMSTDELDAIFDLPFQYKPHPKYAGRRIAAYEMIRFSVNTHRGCFGGCSFCTISAHQGKHIVSRSHESILRQVRKIAQLPDFKGYISDVGGPSANMYGMSGKEAQKCAKCRRFSCLFPKICSNLNQDFEPLLHLYEKIDNEKVIKKSFVSSGIRYDLMSERYGAALVRRHVSGRLKVAPEHTSEHVLQLMRKPSFDHYLKFRTFFYKICRENNLNQQLIPYFISSHPGCTEQDMRGLARWLSQMNYHPTQVQDFTPTPMTLSTTMYYTGVHPYTGEEVFVERAAEKKQKQKSYFFKKHSYESKI